jgi:hypothetical protein
MKRLTTLILPAAALAGCATMADGAPAAEGNTCRNDGLQQYVGQAGTSELGAQILRTSGAKTLQWVASGSMVTMDFRGDRVRVYLDAQNKVERLSCG